MWLVHTAPIALSYLGWCDGHAWLLHCIRVPHAFLAESILNEYVYLFRSVTKQLIRDCCFSSGTSVLLTLIWHSIAWYPQIWGLHGVWQWGQHLKLLPESNDIAKCVFVLAIFIALPNIFLYPGNPNIFSNACANSSSPKYSASWWILARINKSTVGGSSSNLK
jgi:hypothetical protein